MNATEIMQEIETLSNLAPKIVAEESRFLLGINFTDLSGFHIKAQKYWISVLPKEQELIPEYSVHPCVRACVPLQISIGCVYFV